MKQFISLVGILFKARYKFRMPVKQKDRGLNFNDNADGGKKDNTWILYIVMAVAFAPLLIILINGVAQVTPIFAAENALTELMLFIYVITMLVIIVMGVINMLSYVYFNRDAEFLASLPVKNWKIFLAKIFMVYLSELMISAVSILPLNLTIGIISGQGIVFYLGTLLSVFLVPALPMLLASILAVPLMFIVSFFKKKSAVTSIAVVLLVGALFAFYFIFYTQFLSVANEEIDNAIMGLILGIKSWENIFYPITALIKFCLVESVYGLNAGLSAVVNLAIVAGCFAVIIFIAGFIANFVYHKSVISQSDNAKSNSAKGEEFKSAGLFRALMKKEWRTLIRESAFAFQCLFGIVFGPILTVFMAWQFGGIDFNALNMEGIEQSADTLNAVLPAAMLVFMSVFACAGMNIAACSAISREGKNFYMTKLLPVPYVKQIKAKLYVSLIISVAGCFITSLLGVIIMKLPIWQFFLIFSFLCIYAYAFACFAVKFDMSKPRLNWSTPNEAVKNTRSSTVPVLVNLAIGVVLMLLMLVFAMFNLELVMWLVLFAAAILIAWLFHRRLYKDLDAVYEGIEF